MCAWFAYPRGMKIPVQQQSLRWKPIVFDVLLLLVWRRNESKWVRAIACYLSMRMQSKNRLTDHKLVWSIMLTAHGCVYTRKLNDKNFWLTNLINWTQRVVWVNKWTPRVWHISTRTRVMIDYFHLSIANIFSSVWSDVKKATISFLQCKHC